eukprot:1082530_1
MTRTDEFDQLISCANLKRPEEKMRETGERIRSERRTRGDSSGIKASAPPNNHHAGVSLVSKVDDANEKLPGEGPGDFVIDVLEEVSPLKEGSVFGEEGDVHATADMSGQPSRPSINPHVGGPLATGPSGIEMQQQSSSGRAIQDQHSSGKIKKQQHPSPHSNTQKQSSSGKVKKQRHSSDNAKKQ